MTHMSPRTPFSFLKRGKILNFCYPFFSVLKQLVSLCMPVYISKLRMPTGVK